MWTRHPGVAKIDCRDCVKRAHDFDTGEPIIATTKLDGTKVYYDLDTDPLYKPRCLKGESCPRGNPAEGPTHDFTELSWAIVDAYKTNKANFGRYLNSEQLSDELLQDCFNIIAPLFDEMESKKEGSLDHMRMLEFALALRGGK